MASLLDIFKDKAKKVGSAALGILPPVNLYRNVIKPKPTQLRNIDIFSTLAGGALKESLDTKDLPFFNPKRLRSTFLPLYGGIKNVTSEKPAFFSEQVERAYPNKFGKALGFAGEVALPGVGGELKAGKGLLGFTKQAVKKSLPMGALYGLSSAESARDIPSAVGRGALTAGVLSGAGSVIPRGLDKVLGAIGKKYPKKLVLTDLDTKFIQKIRQKLNKGLPLENKESLALDGLYEVYSPAKGAEYQRPPSTERIVDELEKMIPKFDVKKIDLTGKKKPRFIKKERGFFGGSEKAEPFELPQIRPGAQPPLYDPLAKKMSKYDSAKSFVKAQKSVEVPLKDIIPTEGHTADLMATKKARNINEPIRVEINPQGKLQIQDGNHRYFEALNRGDETVKVVFNDQSPDFNFKGEFDRINDFYNKNVAQGGLQDVNQLQKSGLVSGFTQSANVGGIGTTTFKKPYKAGDIKSLENKLYDLLGVPKTGNYKKDYGEMMGMYEGLKTYAEGGDANAAKHLRVVENLMQDLERARAAKNKTRFIAPRPKDEGLADLDEVFGEVKPKIPTVPRPEALKGEILPQTPPAAPPGKPGGSLPGQPLTGLDVQGRPSSKYSFNINRKKLGLQGKAEEKLNDVVETMRPVLEKRRGKPLTNKEVIEGGKKAVMLDEVMGRKEASDFAAKLQASRNFLKTQSESKGLTPEYLAQLEIVSSTAADTGRKLRSFAVDAQDNGIKEAVIKDLQDLGIKTKQLVDAAKSVDWSDTKQVTEFYRKFKPASLAKKLEEYRYTNMLSSPNTHIVNAFSNFLQSGVLAPIEKTVTGGLDWAKSAFTGSERQYYASQGVDYAKGYWKSLPTAFSSFKNTLLGRSGLMKPDIDFLPTGTGKLHQLYTTPLRALEASDQFFRTMIKGGEIESLKRVGIEGAEAMSRADKEAQYRLFRQAFDPEGKLGQGTLLKVWDKWNSGISNLRRLPGGRWIVPFLQTPTNILKQGVEYSPLGLATIPGSKEPLVQLSKAIIGSSVFVGAYSLAESGVTTWDAPTKTKERERFYAAGLQPYSIKLGDTWYSYSKLGPLSYPIAMAAAMKWARDNGTEDDALGTAGAGVGGFLQFFADQSYVQGIGDIIDAVRGDEFKQGRALANIPSQLIPYRAFQGWVARLMDPVYRKTTGGTVLEQTKKSIISQIPILSKGLEPYTTPTGEPSERSLPGINAFSPIKVSQQRFPYEQPTSNKISALPSARSALDVSAAAPLPTNPNDLKVLYKDALKTVTDYPDYSSKLRQGLKDNKTLPEAQAELVAAKNLIKRIEKENPGVTFDTKKLKEEKELLDAEYSLAIDQYKRADDIEGWLDTTEQYISYLKGHKETLTDKADKVRTQNKIEDLEAQMSKYKGYGGFTKGRSKKLTAMFNALNADMKARSKLRESLLRHAAKQDPYSVLKLTSRGRQQPRNLNQILRQISKRTFKIPTARA